MPETLRSAIETACLSQREIATRLGIAYSALGHYLAGRRGTPPTISANLADVLRAHARAILKAAAYLESPARRKSLGRAPTPATRR